MVPSIAPPMSLSLYFAILAVVLGTFLLVRTCEAPILGFIRRCWPGDELNVDGSMLLLGVMLVVDVLVVVLLVRTALLP